MSTSKSSSDTHTCVTENTSTIPKLTDKQRQVLQFVADEIKAHSMPPTRAEIADYFHFKSHNAAQSHLEALHQRGAIELPLGISRGIKITRQGWAALGVMQWTDQWAQLNKGPEHWSLFKSKTIKNRWEFYAAGSLDSFIGKTPEECINKAYEHTIVQAIIASGVQS